MATIIEDLSRIRAIHTDSEYVCIYQKYSTYLLNGIRVLAVIVLGHLIYIPLKAIRQG